LTSAISGLPAFTGVFLSAMLSSWLKPSELFVTDNRQRYLDPVQAIQPNVIELGFDSRTDEFYSAVFDVNDPPAAILSIV
jgi:hypothetical protein